MSNKNPNPAGRLVSHFNEAMAEADALADYFGAFKNVIINSRIMLEKDYKIGIELSEIFDSILKKEGSERDVAVCDAKKQTILGIAVDDIVELSLIERNGKTVIDYSLKDRYGFNKKYSPSFARKQINSIENQREILVRSILTNIVIIYEIYLTSSYKFLVLREPNTYFEGATVKVSDLFKGDIKKIISEKVRQEVNSNMFDSLEALDKIKDKSGVDIDRYVPIRSEFEEIYYRRNVFIHNNGFANEIYLGKVDKQFSKDINLNSKLICDDVYLNNAISILKKIVCSLFFELLRNVQADKDAFFALTEDVGFNALENGDYVVAEHVYGILRRHREFKFIDKTIYEINYMISLKQQGKPIDKLLYAFDVSAMEDRFKIARECLMDNNDKAFELLTGTYPYTFSAAEIRDWPLFINFRESEFFEKFKAEHVDDFKSYIFAEPEIAGNIDVEENNETI